MHSLEPIILGNSPFVKKLRMYGISLIVLGAVLSGVGVAMDGGFNAAHILSTYLIGLIYWGGISLTALFLVALQFLTRAGWMAAIRRVPEIISSFLPLFILGLIPILLGGNILYDWFDHAKAASDHLLHKKQGYLNQTFFFIRIGLYAVVWMLMYRTIVGNSFKQDKSQTDITPTKKNLKFAAPFILLYALTLTFFSFDVIMSLESRWFSTIFGLYSFAGHLVATFAFVSLIVMMLDNAGHLKGILSKEHYHDIGKFMFAFTVFFSYIAFSQYFIIWYGNLPEETFYFTKRINGGWEIFGWLSLALCFVVPFLALIRQDVKRDPKKLMIGAVIVLVAHYIDLCWIILPVFSKTIRFGGLELGMWLLIGGIFLFWLSINFAKKNILAINDPFLHESLSYSS